MVTTTVRDLVCASFSGYASLPYATLARPVEQVTELLGLINALLPEEGEGEQGKEGEGQGERGRDEGSSRGGDRKGKRGNGSSSSSKGRRRPGEDKEERGGKEAGKVVQTEEQALLLAPLVSDVLPLLLLVRLGACRAVLWTSLCYSAHLHAGFSSVPVCSCRPACPPQLLVVLA